VGWRRFFTRGERDREREAEINAHLDEAFDYYRARGLSVEDAARRARLRFGNARVARERTDDMNRLPIFDTLGRDLRFALRRIRKAPGFSLTVIATLAVVVGATSAVFSLADAILLKPLPVPDPAALSVVGFARTSPSGSYTGAAVDGAMWAAVRDHATRIDAAIASRGTSGVNFLAGSTPSFVQNARVGAGYFRVLGLPLVAGREFSVDDAVPNGPPVAILSQSFWRRAFDADPSVIGRAIRLRGEPYTVIGVASDAMSEIEDADVWTPLRGAGQGLNYQVIARLRPGVSREDANAELASLGDSAFTMLRPLQPGSTRALTLVDLQATLSEEARGPIVILGWAVAAVLVIACVNIAALLLARGGSRAREIATRMALGSGRLAVMRQLMIESLVLALFGGAAGLVVAYLGLDALKSLGGSTYGGWGRAALDARAVLVTLGISGLTAVLFGLLPAWQASRVHVQGALSAGGTRSVVGHSRHLLRRSLVVAEVALSVAVLVSAGLLLREFLFLRALDPGFTPDHLYSASASLQDKRYAAPAAVNRLFTTTLESLRATPGISAAAVSQGLPYQRLLNVGFSIEGVPDNDAQPPIANIAYVTPGFFETFGMRIVGGRPLDERDRAQAVRSVVVNESFRDIYFPNQPIVGRRIAIGGEPIEIVGVSRDVQQFGAGFRLPQMRKGPIVTSPTMYVPADQQDAGLFAWFSPVWTVRASSAAEAAAALSTAIASADPQLPVSEVRSMAQTTAESLAEPQLMMILVGALAASALLLAAIGIHGMIVHVIGERTREFGVRIALGASPADVVRGVATSGAVLTAVGAVLGVALSFPASTLVASFVANLSTRDVPTYAGVGLLMVLVAIASSLLPARRLLRMDPTAALRE
jgi:predicted permease